MNDTHAPPPERAAEDWTSGSRVRLLILLLAGCGAIGPLATNLFLPALPAIQTDFGVSVAGAQSMVSVYLVAFAVSLLVSGPMSDRFGRRPVVLGGIAVFCVGQLLAAWAPTLPLLIGARIVQAAGGGAALIVGRAIMGDLFAGPRLASMIATLTMVMVLGTTLSPVLGGYLVEHFSWRTGFWLLAVLGVVLGYACLRQLPETRTARRHASGGAALWRQGMTVIGRPVFLGYIVQAGAIYAVFIVFISLAPYLLDRVYHRSPSEFGLWYFSVSSGYFLGNWYVSQHGHRVDTTRLLKIGLWMQAVSAAAALALGILEPAHPGWIFGPMFPLAVGQGLALPNINARAVSLAPGFAGLATSLITFSMQVVAGLSVQAMGFAPTDTVVPVLTFCAVVSAAAVAATYALADAR